ncbi:hypothetical protein [Bradyrhizobium sp. USDA 223]|uniref:hypothetical protein n=1 Tax=Bradyrhizobium sp. USDA 223 TaxID=3156306 RepID=UPI003836334C
MQASLAGAKQPVEILRSNCELATANVSGLTTQVAYNKKRLADAPFRNRNARKHGWFTRETISERRQIDCLLDDALKLLRNLT